MKRAKIFIAFTFLLAFALQVSAQESSYLNELNNYEFFEKGKLNGLVIGVSTKEDVKRIFGNYCEQECDYDENWKLSLSYISPYSGLQVEKDRVNFPEEQYYGKIWSVNLVPKKKISFRETKFSREFKSFVGYAESCSSDGCERVGPKLKYYVNSSGLSYEICKQSDKLCNKDDLYAIRYSLTKELEETIFDLKTK